MNKLASDYIAIDTNVFEHLFNPQNNVSDHIETLLGRLACDDVHLITDKDGRIWNEYANRITNEIRNATNQNYVSLLRYWLSVDARNKEVNVNHRDSLMVSIKGVIRGGKTTDKIFVYVAIHENRVLITNDRKDILDESNNKNKRRDKLLKIAKQQGFNSVRLYDSREAYDKL